MNGRGGVVEQWLDERLGGQMGTMRKTLYKPLQGGARYVFTLGFVNLFLITNQVLTGLFLMVYYVPAPDHAYYAVKYIQTQVPMGNIVRGLHFWGASALVVMLLLHATRVFFWGAYKRPRELMWVTGTLLLLLVFGFAFTGYLLPWDQKAYWATVVGTNVAGTAPVVGGTIMRILRGGSGVSLLTLTRFYAIHVMLLPWTLVLIALLHMTILQLVDHTPPWDPEKAKVTAPFFPDQAFKDILVAFIVFAGLIVLANFAPPHLGALADPTDTSYTPRPEWYFYALFELLHFFEGPAEIVGTMVLPNLFVLLMLALPFIDRNPSRDPKKRPVALIVGAGVVAGYIGLTLVATVPPATGGRGSITEGRRLYAQLGCASCHSIRGVGGKVGPSLDGVGKRHARDWLIQHFKDPQKMSPGSVMPKYDYLSEKQLNELTDYMESL